MIISGYFSDYHNNKIYLTIYSANGSGTYEIGDTLNNNIHFVFDGKAPIKIKHDMKELFEPIIKTTCKIKLRSNIWCGDILFSQGMGDIIVKVERQLKDTQTRDTLFVGFVKPLSFNQDINNQHNVIDINCVDLLEFLDDRYLSTGLQAGQDSTAWNTAIANSAYRSFVDIFEKIGLYDYEFAFSGDSEYTTLFIDNNGKDSMANTFQLSDNLWLGESVDDEMSMKDIMLELLKYMNCRLASKNGLEFYIISNDNINTTEQYKAYSHTGSAEVTFEDASTLPKADIAKEQVTMDDCYNMIGVKCELETVDDVVSSPLQDDVLTSKFTNKQLFMREFVCDDTDGGLGSAGELVWKSCIFDGELPSAIPSGITDAAKKAYSSLWVRDHYCRIMENGQWTMNNNYIPSSSQGVYTKQYESLAKMNDLYYQTTKASGSGAVYDKLDYNMNLNINPFFVGYIKGSKRTINNPTETADMSKPKTVLVIPCPETWAYGINSMQTKVTEQQAFNWIDSKLAQYEQNPIISYNSALNLNFDPSDNTITNYLVFSGKIKLVPSLKSILQELPGTADQFVGTSTDLSKQQMIYQNIHSPRDWMPATANDKDKTRWYYQQYYTRTYPSNGDIYPTHDPDEGSVSGTVYEAKCPVDPDATTYKRGRLYYIDVEDVYSKQLGWGVTKMEKYDHTTINQAFCSILLCRLQIGDNYLKENFSDNAKSQSFEWTTDSTATFTLAVKPKMPDDGGDPSDFLIGQEYDIMNNITPEMNLNTSGTAIAIPHGAKIQGNVKFDIIAPFNGVVNTQYHYYKHGTWFRDAVTFDSATDVSVLNHVHSINISDFVVTAVSNNAKNSTLNSGDLLYYSEDDKKYNNPKDNIDFKIVTALTSEEATKLNIASGVSFNNPTLSNGALYTTSYQNKPEVQYVNTMYRWYSTPKKIVEYECDYGSTDIGEMVRSVYDCDIMTHLSVPSFSTIMMSSELNLKTDRQKISLREL